MEASKIIVIHPGSQNLRIGRPTEYQPVTILHAVGYKRNNANTEIYQDLLLPQIQKNASGDFEEHRLKAAHSIQTQHREERGNKKLRVSTPPQQIATYNRRSVPEELGEDDEELLQQIKKEMKKDGEGVGVGVAAGDVKEDDKAKMRIFDRDILNLNATEAADYHIHFPMKRGELNLHPTGIGGSLTAVLANLETIWLYAITERVGIPLNKLHSYSAVLIVPDIYNRSHLKELVTLLLQRIRFRACFLLQDHVAATFGAGMGYGCIVDVGDQKCSISCVEDGISQPDTRVRLCYGGGDVTQVYLTLLKKCGFPHKECNVDKDWRDAALIQQLKEQFCHLMPEICGAHEKTFQLRKLEKRLRYSIQVGDECLVAPLSLFYTELMNITGKPKRVVVQLACSQQNDPEDCFDSEYIRETGRRNGRDHYLEGVMPVTGETGDEDFVVVDTEDVVMERENAQKNSDKVELIYRQQGNGQIATLDQAIVRSIERCPTDEMKRRMYSSILLTGGGSKFPGFEKWLKQKIQLQVGTYQKVTAQEPIEINVFKKEWDASSIVWKGGAIMSCLESAPELWIFGNEWEKYGLRVLREKATFLW